jgi:hypothetical protein
LLGQTRHHEYEEGKRREEANRLAEELNAKAEEWRDEETRKIEERVRERRELARAIEESQRAKEQDLLRHRSMLDQMHIDYEARRQDWKAVEASKKDAKEKSRKSICLRLQSWRQRKMLQDQERTQQRMVEEQEALYRKQDVEAIKAAKAKAAALEREQQLRDLDTMTF